MMGLSAGSSEFGSVTDILALIDNDARYAAKLKELDARVKGANTTLAQATEQNKHAENHRALAQQAFEQAQQTLVEANAVKAQNERAAADLAARIGEQDKRQADHAAAVAAFNEQQRLAEADLANRQAALAKRESEISDLHVQAHVDRDESLKAAAAELEKAKGIHVEADKRAADLEAKRNDFASFIERLKGWDFACPA